MTKLGSFTWLQKRKYAGYHGKLTERRHSLISSEKIASIVVFESISYSLTHMHWGEVEPTGLLGVPWIRNSGIHVLHHGSDQEK